MSTSNMNATDDARFWDRVARKYAADPIKDMAGYERSVTRIRSLLAPTASIFELGCGTGTTAMVLAPHVTRIVATDISNEMISIAREKGAAAACRNVDFTVVAGHSLPSADGAFDAVLALNVLHLVPDRRHVLAEVRRILRPGGLFISKTPCIGEMNMAIRLAIPVARAIGKAPHVETFTAHALEVGIAAAAFTIVETSRRGSKRKDPRIFVVARSVSSPALSDHA